MFKYFSISDLQYFLKNGFVFHSNLNCLISKFLSIKFVLHFNVQMTGSVSKAGTILPPKFYLQDFATIWYLIRWLQFWPLALKANVATSWKFGHQVQNLVIRWRHLHWFQCCPPGWVTFWSPDGATCTDCKFGHQEAPLASVANWVPKWHNLHWFKIWSSASAICIASKVGHQVASLHCHIALNCPIGIIS